MLEAMSASAWVMAALLGAQAAPPAATPPPTTTPPTTTPPSTTPPSTTPPTPPPTAAPPVLPTVAALAVRQNAEEQQLRELVPLPLTEPAIHGMAAMLGAKSDSGDAIVAAVDRYTFRTKPEYTRALEEIRPRLTAAFASTPAGAVEPAPGPELVAVLQRSHAWRALLAEADTELLRLISAVRTDEARTTPALQAYQRSAERDDMTSLDPLAGIRLPTLLDVAQLEPVDRRRIEDALDRQWTRCAAAITNRRRALGAIDLQRAQLLESWGPAWELSATPAVMGERQRKLAELEAHQRAAEDDLRAASRESVVQLLRVLPPEAGGRVRTTVDSLMWPTLFVQEALLTQAVTRASQGADPALLPAMQAILLELQRKLEGTRRDLSRKANRAEELESVLASVELGATPAQASAALAAQLELQDVVDRRRKLTRDAAVQLQQMAVASGAPNAGLMKERVTALDADARAAQWLRSGLLERIEQLEHGGRVRTSEDEPASTTPGTTP